MKIQAKILKFCLLIALFAFLSSSSCARGAGCPAQSDITAKTNKKGELKRKKGQQHLFSKKMRRN